LNVLSGYLSLKTLDPAQGKLNYFTKSQLSYEKYDFFPAPLQDAYIRIKTSKGERLRKLLAKELRESYEDLTFATTRLEHILKSDHKGHV
jgi:hypothetical protein